MHQQYPTPHETCDNYEMVSKLPQSLKQKRIIRKTGDQKRNYMKFSQEKLSFLNDFYSKNRYPSKDEMQKMALSFSEKLSKIENWFKHKRRKEVQNGLMKFEKKKVFTKNEIQTLVQEFMRNRNPTSEKYKEIAAKLECQIKHVKNWFSYKRKQLLKIMRIKGKTSKKEAVIRDFTQRIYQKQKDSEISEVKLEENEKIMIKQEAHPQIKIEENQIGKQQTPLDNKEINPIDLRNHQFNQINQIHQIEQIKRWIMMQRQQRAFQNYVYGQVQQNFMQSYLNYMQLALNNHHN